MLLATRAHEFGGMVQIPAGAFIRGDIPSRYDASRARDRAHVQNPGQPIFEDDDPSHFRALPLAIPPAAATDGT